MTIMNFLLSAALSGFFQKEEANKKFGKWTLSIKFRGFFGTFERGGRIELF